MADYNADFQPIGLSTAPFAGSFDGKGHVIRNLHLSGGDAVGLFAYPGTCTLSNIIFDKTCSAEGKNNVGMLAGYARNGGVTISGIENHGSVTATEGYAGALLGSGRVLATAHVSYCCNTGTISAPSNAAAFIGPSAGKLDVAHSYNTGTIVGAVEGKEFAFANKSTIIENCWDYTSTQTNSMTPTQVDNGYLCYQINSGAGSNIWHQNIDNGKPHDPFPVLRNKGGVVYEKDGGYTNYNPNPPKYRYYNLVVTKLRGCTNGCIQFSEFDILDEKGNEVEDLYIYDGTESSIGHENWENAADNSVNTKYCNNSFRGYAYFLFDATRTVGLCGYRIYTANDTGNQPGRNPSSWALYGSNTQLYDPDDPGWELIEEREDDQTLQATNYTPYDFYISDPIKALTLSEQTATIMRGEKQQLHVNFTPSTLQGLELQWTTTNPSVAMVNNSGLVVARSVGTADIIVSAVDDNSLRDTCTITVVERQPGYRYYQFAIQKISSGTAIQLSEIDILDEDGNEIEPLTLYAYTGSFYSDEVQENLFDQNVYTKYCGPFSSANTLYLYVDADAVWTLLDHRENDTTLGATNYTPYDFFIPELIIPGDVNGDGLVDDVDLVVLKRHIIGKPVDKFVFEAADLNMDEKVNAQDVVTLINMLMTEF